MHGRNATCDAHGREREERGSGDAKAKIEGGMCYVSVINIGIEMSDRGLCG